MSLKLNRETLRQIARQQLLSLQQAGITEWPSAKGNWAWGLEAVEEAGTPSGAATARPATGGPAPAGSAKVPQLERASAPPSARPVGSSSSPPAPPLHGLGDPYGAALQRADRESGLQVLQERVAACTRCPELVRNRSQTVFGVGEVQPRLVFLGEAPGADEDRQGEPFVGRAGQLLDRVIAAMGLARSEVYILNAVKCRPPQNRNPAESEIGHCWEYLEAQLEILRPEVICCLGSVAARTLLRTSDSIARLRGCFHQYRGSKVRVTYHPSYLLRSGDSMIRGRTPKQLVWEDMKAILAELGLAVPPPSGG